jgi:alanyl-tRNA synthetase
VTVLGTERIQDGVVRLTYAAGERALDVLDDDARILADAGHRLSVPREKIPEGIDRLLDQLAEARQRAKGQAKQDLRATAERLLGDPARTTVKAETTVVAARVEGDRTALIELSRYLTHGVGKVAILASEHDGRGILFIGSTDPRIGASAVLDSVRESFGGRGGGNPAAATAVGDPGAPLDQALALARDAALNRVAAPR